MKTIKFTNEMIERILEGKKTETRRPIKGQPKYTLGREYRIEGTDIVVYIKDISAHELQDMSYARGDYWSEGIIPRHDRNCEIQQFMDIWNGIYGDTEYSWRNNPFVYVYTFKLVK